MTDDPIGHIAVTIKEGRERIKVRLGEDEVVFECRPAGGSKTKVVIHAPKRIPVWRERMPDAME